MYRGFYLPSLHSVSLCAAPSKFGISFRSKGHLKDIRSDISGPLCVIIQLYNTQPSRLKIFLLMKISITSLVWKSWYWLRDHTATAHYIINPRNPHLHMGGNPTVISWASNVNLLINIQTFGFSPSRHWPSWGKKQEQTCFKFFFTARGRENLLSNSHSYFQSCRFRLKPQTVVVALYCLE